MNKKLLLFFLLVTLIIVMMGFPLFFGKNSISQQHHLRKENASQQAKIDSMQKVLEERSLIIKRLQTDSLYIEEQLRTRYGMSRKGEKVFQFIK